MPRGTRPSYARGKFQQELSGELMKVTVKLIGPLVYEGGFSEKELALPGPMTAGELSAYVKIDRKRPTIITRNGRAAAPDDMIEEGDRVVISHIYSGG